MTGKQKIGFSIFIFLGLIILGAGFLFLKIYGVGASEIEKRGKIVWQAKMAEDLDSDGKNETIYLTSYQSDEKRESYISTRKNIFTNREYGLSGFEEDLAFCPNKYFTDNTGNVYLCIFGMVGAHSENIQIIKYNDFKAVDFYLEDGTRTGNISCDVPNFDFDYLDKAKIKIYFDNRDYDKNPLVDIIRTHYYLDNNAFRYNGNERIGSEGLIK